MITRNLTASVITQIEEKSRKINKTHEKNCGKHIDTKNKKQTIAKLDHELHCSTKKLTGTCVNPLGKARRLRKLKIE